VKSSPKSIYFLKSKSSRNQKKPKQSRFKKPKQTQKKKSILIPENKKSYDKEKKGNAKSNEYGREREITCLREEITTEAPSNPNLSAMEKPIP
jgi:spore germination cell wall hydrolase CwlJ-like protein